MKCQCRQTVLATYPLLDPKKRKFGFELFGLDFIVDSNCKPLLIEVNTNPCLELPCKILERLIPKMLENAFRLAVDPLFRPTLSLKVESYYLYDKNFLEKNKFCLIFDEAYDRNPNWEHYLKTSESSLNFVFEFSNTS
jgi:tubulin polyglutamylase TTLL1